MDKVERENWEKIKEAMEASGNTDNFFYKRAVIISKGGNDPIDLPSLEDPDENAPSSLEWVQFLPEPWHHSYSR